MSKVSTTTMYIILSFRRILLFARVCEVENLTLYKLCHRLVVAKLSFELIQMCGSFKKIPLETISCFHIMTSQTNKKLSQVRQCPSSFNSWIFSSKSSRYLPRMRTLLCTILCLVQSMWVCYCSCYLSGEKDGVNYNLLSQFEPITYFYGSYTTYTQ